MSVLFTNNANTILAAPVNTVQTTISLNAGTGSKFPAPTSPDFAFVTLISATNPSQFEIVRVTARSTDTLTVVRAQEGTSAQSFNASDICALLWTTGGENSGRNQVSLPTSTGSANAQVVVNTVPLLTFGKGSLQVMIPGFTNTGSMTLNSDTTGVTTCKAFGQNLQAGMVVATVPAVFYGDGTNWTLVNPQIPFVGLPTSTGSANAQAVANTLPLVSTANGTKLQFVAGFTNTGPATLAADATSALPLHVNGAALVGGEILSGVIINAESDGTNWNVLNPTPPSRNVLVDPCCRVGQGDGTINLGTGYKYGLVDMINVKGSGTAVNAGTITQDTTGVIATAATPYSVKAAGVTITGTGKMFFRRFVESRDSCALNGKRVLFSILGRHDVGSTIPAFLTINKFNAQDTSGSGVTALVTGANVNMATGTDTIVGTSVLFGASDGSNGLEIILEIDCGAVTTKNFYVTDWQAATTLAQVCGVPKFADDLMQAMRYFEKSFSYGTAPQSSTTTAERCYTTTNAIANNATSNNSGQTFIVDKLAVPTVTISSPNTGTNNRQFDLNTAADAACASSRESTKGFYVQNTSGGTIAANDVMSLHFKADCRIT